MAHEQETMTLVALEGLSYRLSASMSERAVGGQEPSTIPKDQIGPKA